MWSIQEKFCSICSSVIYCSSFTSSCIWGTDMRCCKLKVHQVRVCVCLVLGNLFCSNGNTGLAIREFHRIKYTQTLSLLRPVIRVHQTFLTPGRKICNSKIFCRRVRSDYYAYWDFQWCLSLYLLLKEYWKPQTCPTPVPFWSEGRPCY